MARVIGDPQVLGLVDALLATHTEQTPLRWPADGELFDAVPCPHGLPIGNLTSQFFANVYLNGLDHFVSEQLGIRDYVRYVDDFALFGDDHAALAAARQQIESYLAGLRLQIHPVKSQLFETRHGASFVGFRVLPDRVRVRNANLQRARVRFDGLRAAYRSGLTSWAEIKQSLQSWSAHLAHGDTWQLRRQVFSSLAFARS